MEEQWSENAARNLADFRGSASPKAVTWFNHHTLQATVDAGTQISKFDYVGLDGSFLRRLVAPSLSRTSADLVLPKLIGHMGPDGSIGLIGSTGEQLAKARRFVEAGPSRPNVILTVDGYSGILDKETLVRRVNEAKPDLLILGLGAPLQDEWALILKQDCPDVRLIATCGGWLDQITQPEYYPSFAYRLRLNWLIRLAREPRRLWRRYTVEAIRAIRVRRMLRATLLTEGAYALKAMEEASRYYGGRSDAPSSI